MALALDLVERHSASLSYARPGPRQDVAEEAARFARVQQGQDVRVINPARDLDLAQKVLRTTEHHHVGVGLLTPHDVHYGLAEAKRDQRARILAKTFARHPERFRFRPQEMALALVATALAQASVSVISLNAGLSQPLLLTGFFVALWLTSAWLFRKAAREHNPAGAAL